MMYQDPSEQRGVLHCMAYVHTPHMIIQDYEFSLVKYYTMFIDLQFIYLVTILFFGILNSLQYLL